MNIEHTHSIGKLMLAFTCFWTYIAFSQLLLIWIAGLPEETPFYITRFNARLGRDGRVPDLRPLLASVRRAAVALAQAESEAAGDRRALDPLHPLRRHLLAGDADRSTRTAFTFHWTQPLAFRRRAAGHRRFGVSRLRGKLPDSDARSYLAESCGTDSHERTQPTYDRTDTELRTRSPTAR
jgi:hypothetical protein